MTNNNNSKPLKSYKGTIHDLAYVPAELVYDSVEAFINDISEREINIAMDDFPNSYKEDDIYNKYKRLKDSQEISENELNELLDMYNYEIVE